MKKIPFIHKAVINYLMVKGKGLTSGWGMYGYTKLTPCGFRFVSDEGKTIYAHLEDYGYLVDKYKKQMEWIN